jgi:formimidoylglutamate deiminase
LRQSSSAEAIRQQTANEDRTRGRKRSLRRNLHPHDASPRSPDPSKVRDRFAEQTREISDFETLTGRRPGAWMLDEFGLDSRCCLVHCTHLDTGETRALAQSGAIAGVCPVTEANLGDGIFNGPEWLTSGGSMGIGTDSNVSIDLAGELRLLEYSQRLRDRQRLRIRTSSPSVGRSLYAESLAGGASALGRQTGPIECGNRAGCYVARDAIERAYRETIAALRARL